MFQLRIYTLRSPEVLRQYADMAGFDVANIIGVETTLLDPTTFSPVH